MPWCGVLPANSYSKNSRHFIEPKCSSLHSQMPASKMHTAQSSWATASFSIPPLLKGLWFALSQSNITENVVSLLETADPTFRGFEIVNTQTCSNVTYYGTAGCSLFKTCGKQTLKFYKWRLPHFVFTHFDVFPVLPIQFSVDSAVPNLAASTPYFFVRFHLG